jgi:hypothetical protein
MSDPIQQLPEFTRRVLLASKAGGRAAMMELIEAAFSAELLAPGQDLWIVSPWLSDVPILGNEAGGYTTLCPDFSRTRVPVSSLLGELVQRGTTVHVVTRPDEGDAVVRNARSVAGDSAPQRLRHVRVKELHAKVMLSRSMAIRGSMNLTFNGTGFLDELESFTTDPEEIATIRVDLEARYGRGP